MIHRANSPRRGAVLIIVLGVLVVLTLLGTTFAQVSTLNREVARGYLDEVRARLVARAGIERAAAEIMSAAQRGTFNDPAMTYWGGSAFENGDPDAAHPLELATNPSYALEDEKIQNPADDKTRPLPFTIDGRPAGLSGTLSAGSYAPNGDAYRLRAIDSNGAIHVNDGLESGNSGHGSRNLTRILNILGDLRGVRGAGDRLVTQRPPGGYRAKSELKSILGSDDYAKLRNFITVSAWTDPDVVNPVALSRETASAMPVPYGTELGIFRYGRSRDAYGTLIDTPLVFAPDFVDPKGDFHAVMALDEIAAPWIERTRRAPVNVNAAPREVLIALITGLQGWFVVERRRNNPVHSHLYGFRFYRERDNAPGPGKQGDEYGWLYSTAPFTGPGTTADAGVPAQQVADEIIACRRRLPSPHCPTVDYARAWYGGPFRSWRQFNAFCDGLAEGGLLRDNRKIFYDLDPVPPANSEGQVIKGKEFAVGPATLVPSPIQPLFAARAMADVLKANFNPNCTLNELNPDANLYLIVDKTDLLCHSTEFCFASMGTYEIESEGLVIETAGGADLLAVREGRSIARAAITCTIRGFDAHRETTQADFYRGDPARPGTGASITNNGRTVELGPEPDNGPAPAECRWSGWMQLPTLGGNGREHAKRSTERTPCGGAERGEALHAHFQLDHDLHHHSGGDSMRACRSKAHESRNNPDRTEALGGPYGPATGTPDRHRLARDWSRDARGSGVVSSLTAASDLRIDGAYIERDSAVLWDSSFDSFTSMGTVAFWAKPSFHPEMTGKPRTWFNFDALCTGGLTNIPENGVVPRVLGIWFLASHDEMAFKSSLTEHSSAVYFEGPWRPMSLLAGYSNGKGGTGIATRSLNHRSHTDHLRRDDLSHHGWIHVAFQWDFQKTVSELWINGEAVRQTGRIQSGDPSEFLPLTDWLPGKNPFRLGDCSETMTMDKLFKDGVTTAGPFSRNWAADATIDEFHLWNGARMSNAQDLYAAGRYHVPRPGQEGRFTSAQVEFRASDRRLAPASTTTYIPLVSQAGGRPIGRRQETVTEFRPAQSRRILAAAWTWHAESVSPEGMPLMYDARLEDEIPVTVELSLSAAGVDRTGALVDDGGSSVPNLLLVEGEALRYQVTIRMAMATVDTILLATPVVDDVTIYSTTGVEFLSYELSGTAAQ